MIHSRNRQGSVLMLVVGLLTIVAMLGSTLMITSYLSARQTHNIVVRGTIPMTAGGVLLVLQNQLLHDKHVKAKRGDVGRDTGPYGSYAKTPTSWKYYIDLAGLYVPSTGKYYDMYLTEIARIDAEPAPYWGQVFGPKSDRLKDVDTDGDAVIDTSKPDEEPGGDGEGEVDDDIEGIYLDAYLMDAAVVDARGRKCYVAMRVIDTSGLIGVNTGGEMDKEKMLFKPVNVDLEGLLKNEDSGAYSELHRIRSGEAQASLANYSEDCAEVLLSAAEGGRYKPFPISDEVFLRWRRPFAESERSKLRDVLRKVSSETETSLTTISISSSIPRHPARGTDNVSGLTRRVIEKIGADTSLASFMMLEPLYIKFRHVIGLSSAGRSDIDPIVMDDADGPPGIMRRQFVEGSGWFDMNGWVQEMSVSAHVNDLYSCANLTDTRILSMRFTPTIAEDGNYAVYLWWPSDVNTPARAQNVKVTVVAADESPTMVVDQSRALGPSSENAEDWHQLGTFHFDPNKPGYVEIESTGQMGSITAADGVKFVYQPVMESQEAAHFVANMWAHTSDKDAISESFKYKPSDAEWSVYGVVEQLVISEVYVYNREASENKDGQSNQDEQWAVAIELFNPTDEPVTVAAGGHYYRLVCGDKTWSFGNPTNPVKVEGSSTVQPDKRFVLYAIHNGAGVPEGDRLTPGDCYFETGDVFDVDAGGSGASVLAGFFENGLRIERYFDGTTKPAMDSIRPYELPPGWRSESAGSQSAFVMLRDDYYRAKDKRLPDTKETDNGLSKHGRYRALLPVYVTEEFPDEGPSDSQHTLGGANELTENDLAAIVEVYGEVYEGFWIRRLKGIPSSVGGFGDVYLVGPDTDGNDLPHKLLVWVENEYGNWAINDRKSYYNKTSRGRANLGKVNPDPEKYPDLPWGTLIAEIIEVEVMKPGRRNPIEVAGSSGDSEFIFTRIYGRININTAPKEILAKLPWPTTLIAHSDGGEDVEWALAPDVEIDPVRIAEYILTYRRDKNSRSEYHYLDNQIGLPHPETGESDTLRQHVYDGAECSAFEGFLSPGELMIPLADYVEKELMGGVGEDIRRQAYFLQARDSLYRAVANLITVNSDTFAATIYLQMEGGDRAGHYVALIDRSNCRRQAGTEDAIVAPVVLLMTEVK